MESTVDFGSTNAGSIPALSDNKRKGDLMSNELDWTRIPEDYIKYIPTGGDGDYSPYLSTQGGEVKIRYAARSWWNGGIVNEPFMEGYWVMEDTHDQKFYKTAEFLAMGFVPISHKLVKICFEELVKYPWPFPDNPEDSILYNWEGVENHEGETIEDAGLPVESDNQPAE